MQHFYYKYSENSCGYVKVISHPENKEFLVEDGWKLSADDLRPPRKRRTKAELEEAKDDGDSSAGN